MAAASLHSDQSGVEFQGEAAVVLPFSRITIAHAAPPPSRALGDILRERESQLAMGFTAEKDDSETIAHFVGLVWSFSQECDRAWPMGQRKRQDHALLRRFLVKLGALCLASIERIDRQFPTK